MTAALGARSFEVRPFRPEDAEQVTALAPRLAERVAAWREPAAVLAAVQGWVRDSVQAAGEPGHAVLVAAAAGQIAGVVTVAEREHFTGQIDAYAGELAVRRGLERRGVASALMAAAERWAAQRGLRFITLETGAANGPARRLYESLGYQDEDVRLTKAVGAAGPEPGLAAGPGEQPSGPFEYQVSVRWRDVDALGHVNHAVFLTYLEEARDAFYARVLRGDPDYVVVRIEADLRAEVRYPDRQVTARIAVERVGTTSLTTRETVLTPSRQVAADARVVTVRWDASQRRRVPFTPAERAELAAARAG